MQIACLLFEGVTALDAVGPYEVLSRLPGADLCFVGKERGEVRTDNGVLGLTVDRALADVAVPAVLVVPGGWGTRHLVDDHDVLEWVRAVHAHTAWTTSVCTGSLVLGAAGLLDGVEATTHWAQHDALARYGARPVAERVVARDRIVTAAGVSAGIDMALWLAAQLVDDTTAQCIQLGIEYDPQPPFAAGSPTSAPIQVTTLMREMLAGRDAG